MSRTRKWSCRVTAVAELLTGGGGEGGGEAGPAARPGHGRARARQAHRATPASQPPAPRSPLHLPGRLSARLVRGGLTCSLCRAPGAAAPCGPLGVPGRARPPGPLSRRHHDGGNRPVPGAHRALGDAAAGEGSGGGQACAGRGCLRGEEGNEAVGEDCVERASSDGAERTPKTPGRGKGTCKTRKSWENQPSGSRGTWKGGARRGGGRTLLSGGWRGDTMVPAGSGGPPRAWQGCCQRAPRAAKPRGWDER